MFDKIKDEIKDYFSHLGLFSKNIRLFLWGSFFLGISQSVFFLIYNLFLKDIGYTESFIGHTLSVSSLGTVLFSLPLAYVMPRIKLKRIIVFLPVLLCIFTLWQTFLTDEVSIMISSFFKGIIYTVLGIISAPFFMRNSTEKERSHIFSLSFALGLASGFIGNFLSGIIFKYSGKLMTDPVFQNRSALVFSALSGLFAIFYFLKLDVKNIERSEGQKIVIADFPLKFIFRVSFPQFVIGLGAGLVIPFVNLFLKNDWDLSTDRISVIFAISQLFMFFGIVVAPVCKKYFGMMRTVVVTQLLSMPFMYFLGFSKVFPLVEFSFYIRAALMNMAAPLITNFMLEKVDEAHQYSANAVATIAWTGAWVFSAYLGGTIIEKYGFKTVFTIAIILYFVSSAMYYFFFIKKRDDG